MNKVLLGLSGGIDSAAAASLLKEQGFQVTGCFLLLTPDSDENSEEAKSARALAEHLGIDFITADYRERFKKNVSEYFISEYLSGKTPNPCVRCNPTVKIRSLIDEAQKAGADFVATGHYAKAQYSEKHGGVVIKAAASKKDQSYFLSGLSADMPEKLIFPLGDFSSKEEIREYAMLRGFPNAQKADSQEICFIPEGDYQSYIRKHTSSVCSPGSFLDNEGKIIGTHTGIINYTVGQRKGLGAFGEPRYVKFINARDNTVTLCKKDERFSSRVVAEGLSLAVKNHPGEKFEALVKIRSTAAAVKAQVELRESLVYIDFSEKVLAPSPGQTAALYDGDIIIGSAVILSAE